MGAGGKDRLAVVVKGFPRLSETFVAQELLGLEQRGLRLDIWSLRHPTDRVTHPMHRAIRAPRHYLPDYLRNEPLRVLRGFAAAFGMPGLRPLLGTFLSDLKRDPTANRLRRLGQACVLARELDPATAHIHAHFLHTPASVARYAATLRGLRWSFSAHAKDIWTIPDWEKREKIADSAFGVTCTRTGAEHLSSLAPDGRSVELLYHGLDLSRFPAPPEAKPARDGSDAADPVRILSVGRAVEKKGFDDLLAALAALPSDLAWTFAHVGGGPLLPKLKEIAEGAGIAHRVAFLGAKAQPEVIALMREADLFALPSREAADGDRDGLPNVLMEAASQGLPIVATDFAAIPEFVRDGREAVLVPPGDWAALSNALNLLARDPERRAALGAAAGTRLRDAFGADENLDRLTERLRTAMDGAPAETAEATRSLARA